MAGGNYQIRQCRQGDCGLRFPLFPAAAAVACRCPRCGGATALIAAESLPNPLVQAPLPPKEGVVLEALLDNIRSAYNVGSMFRSADAAGIRCLHLGGITPTPRNRKVAKTALGAEQTVAWRHHPNGLEAAFWLRRQGCTLWALEGGPGARNLFEMELDTTHLVLICGNEVTGVDPDILAACHQVVSLPMCGSKTSLNVAVAFGIAVFVIRHLRRQAIAGVVPGRSD